MKRIILKIIVISSISLSALPVVAGAFWPGTVISIAPTDTLKVRKWPASTSQILEEYILGENISLTGRCKNTVTNVSFQIDSGGTANSKYSKMKKANVWCQTMTPSAKVGWVRGSFVWPE
jgi:hypothetical protein